MRHVIIDTDIDSDVDDLLALVFTAKAPELCLEGITTDLFLFETGDVAICTEDNRLGHLVRHENPAGKISAAYELNIESAQNFMLSYITR